MTNLPQAIFCFAFLLVYHKMVEKLISLDMERDLFKSGHLQFVHNLREGLIIMKDGSFKTVKLINVAARQMLQLPFAADNGDQVDARYLEQLELKKIELGKQTSGAIDIGNTVYRSESSIPLKDAIDESLNDENASSNSTIY